MVERTASQDDGRCVMQGSIRGDCAPLVVSGIKGVRVRISRGSVNGATTRGWRAA